MTKEATAGTRLATGGDEFIGRAYVCCRGPLRNQTIRVTGLRAAEGEDRYELEAEGDGHRWTIGRERLARIFGDSASRNCGCYPLKPESEVGAATHPGAPHEFEARAGEPRPESHGPAGEKGAALTDAQPPRQEHTEPEERQPVVEKAGGGERTKRQRRRTPAAATDAQPANVIFREESPQGALF
jgi:hypothetical protein